MKAAFYEITEEWQKQKIISGLSGHELSFFEESLNENTEAPKDTEILGVFINSRVSKKVLEKFPGLKLIVTFSTGFDHIDVLAAKEQKITVCNVPSYGENTVAEFTFALILALTRKIYSAIKRVREQGLFSYEGLRGFDLKGKVLGVIGTGKIGSQVIRIAKGFEMDVLAFDPHPKEELESQLDFKYADFETVLKESDIVSIHVPYMPATHHLINSEKLKLFKPAAFLINTSRGGLLDTMALLNALKNKELAGAALDVLEEEGFVADELTLFSGHPNEAQLKTILADHELMQMENAIVTPHNAFNTQEALERIFSVSIGNITAFLEGNVQNQV